MTPPVDMPAAEKRPHFEELDGIRALSVLLVVGTHLYPPYDPRLYWGTGWLGVDVFFVLSGFLVTLLALREEGRRGRLDLKAFYIRRVHRILPPYLLVLGVYVVLLLVLGVGDPTGAKAKVLWSALPYYLAFLQEVPFYLREGGEQPFYQSWSLGIEEKFYFLWPVLGFVALQNRDRGRLTVLIVGGALLAAAPFLSAHWVADSLQHYFKIAVGCALAVVWDRLPPPPPLLRGTPAQLALGAAIVGMHLAFRGVHFHSARAQALEIPYALLWAAMIWACLSADGALARVFRLPALVHLGRLSYGIYLVHNLALSFFRSRIPTDAPFVVNLAYAAAAVGVTIALAHAMYRWFEQPLIARGRRLASG